jgi:hypothetical protein
VDVPLYVYLYENANLNHVTKGTVYPYSMTYCRALPLIGKTNMYGATSSQKIEATLLENVAKYFYD